MRTVIATLAALLLTALPLPASAASPKYVGSGTCTDCHQAEYAAWKESHHYQAMLPASQETVLGNFDGAVFEYGGVRSRFFRRESSYRVETDGPDGNLTEYEIAYTFGFEPIQQYLIAFPGGRYQALNIVWDNRGAAQGGQRWTHLYPDDGAGSFRPVTQEDIVHWTGSFQNWNGRCAACHSTGLEKNYRADSDTFDTRWQEINVACEACHGPASAHLAWAEGDATGPGNGFTFSLADRGAFGPAEGGPAGVFRRLDDRRPVTQVETCAACHARRSEWADHEPGQAFDEQYRLALLEPGLYFPDGQILDEVYVYGSFLQSRMHAAGVVCTDCHEPHRGAVRSSGNDLCTRCHLPSEFDVPAHHRHPAGSPGAACIDCHMPDRTYMVVDDRRDHGFRVPEPRLTLELGVPNACNRCHTERDARWAQAALEGWGMGKTVRAGHAATFASAWAGQSVAVPDLTALASDAARPAMLRASAVHASAAFPGRETLTGLTQWLYDDDPRVRAAAAQSVDWLNTEQRWAVLKSLMADRVKSVRMAVARQTADVPVDALPPAEGQALAALRREYLQALQHNADQPEELVNLGVFRSATGDVAGAEQAYRRAIRLAPAFTPAMLNLADLYRANGLDHKAAPLLEQAVLRAPGEAAPHFALGLLRVRQGQLAAALPQLRRAAEIEPGLRYRYVLAVALWDSGEQPAAVAELEDLLVRFPGNRQVVEALAAYYRELGEVEKLERLTP